MSHTLEPPLTANGKDDGTAWARWVRHMADDDFSAVRAHATLEIHMKECSERQAEIRAGMLAIHGRLDALQRSVDERLTAVANRMWTAAGTLILALIGGLATTIFFLLTKAH